MEENERSEIEAAIGELQSAIQADADVEEIKAKMDKLAQASHNLAQKAYSQQSEQAETPNQADPSSGANQYSDAVDADFTEVKDK